MLNMRCFCSIFLALSEQVNNTIVELEGLRRRSEQDEVAQEAAAKVAAIARGQARKLRWVLAWGWSLHMLSDVCCFLPSAAASAACCCPAGAPPRSCRRGESLPRAPPGDRVSGPSLSGS
jgi:hypothetical protein